MKDIQIMKKVLLLFLVAFLPIIVNAEPYGYNYNVDGIYYSLDSETKVKVVNPTFDRYYLEYGDEHIDYNPLVSR